MKRSLPILYFHRVNTIDPPHLATHPESFEKLLAFLKNLNYRSLLPHEIIPYLEEKKPPFRRIVFTFDDGYGDNYRYAYPLMKKYGFSGMVFVVTRHIRDRGELAPEIPFTQANRNLWRVPPDQSQFLTWEQIREMEKEQTLFAFSHSHTHRQSFQSDEPNQIYDPHNPHWGITSIQNFSIPQGLFADLPRKSALLKPSFFPNPQAMETLGNLIKRDPNQNWFELKREAQREGLWPVPGIWESQEEFQNRVRLEFKLSKEIIENKTQKPSPHFCWPWGQSSREALGIAKSVGYEFFYNTSTGPNHTLEDREGFHRFQIKFQKFRPLPFRLALLLRRFVPLAKIYQKLKG